jgi:hypothetical protein
MMGRQGRWDSETMSWWAILLIVTTATWSLWVVVGLLELRAEKLEGKRPADAGFSAVPVIPLFPMALLGAAALVDRIKAPWGTMIVLWLHVALAAGIVWAIVSALRRGRAAKRLHRSG